MNPAVPFAAALVAVAATALVAPRRAGRGADRAGGGAGRAGGGAGRAGRSGVSVGPGRSDDDRSDHRDLFTGTTDGPVGFAVARSRRRRAMKAAIVAMLAGVATAVFVGGAVGMVIGAAAAVGCYRFVSRLEPGELVRERRRAEAELPFALDLVGTALRSGAPVDRALLAVGRALNSPLGRRIEETGRAYRLGASAERAWQPLGDLEGAEPLVGAATRAAESGAALAGACARLAATLREGADARSDTAARQAGVLIVLPLGCCFLPAFVLVGVVPIVLGVLDDVLV